MNFLLRLLGAYAMLGPDKMVLFTLIGLVILLIALE
jgi:hypothetical protein